MKKLKSRAYKDRLKGHKDTIIYLHSPQGPEGGLLYSGSADYAFRAWDLVKRQTNFKGQIAKSAIGIEVSCFFTYDGNIVTGFTNGHIQINRESELEQISALEGHESAVTTIQKSENNLYTGSHDCTVRVWNLETYECDLIYQFGNPVSCFQVVDQMMAVGCWDKTLKIVDLERQMTQDQITASNEAIRAITVYGNEVFVAGCDPIIRAWNLETRTSRIFMGHKDWVLGLYFHNDLLYSVSYDKTIRVWNLETTRCVEEFCGHEDGVVCLEFANGMMYSGSHDHSIRSWDIQEMEMRIAEKAAMMYEDIQTRKIETYFRVLAKRRGKKGKRGKGKGKKGKKGRR